ncbi:MAG: hypothetical protein O7E52_16855 [Candidatus Poribacteria bacterium]|nr:hypothetical protein [Candidatus Poribacteria bacterium]
MFNRNWRFTILCILFSIYLLSAGTPGSIAEKPRLISATSLSQAAVQLRFDRALDRESAENASNYRIEPGIESEWATLDPRMNTVLLHTTPLDIDKKYMLAIQGVRNAQTPPTTIDPLEAIPLTPSDTMEITFGKGNTVTFSGVLKDTSLIVHPKKKMRNHNAGGEEFLLCTPIGGAFFAAFAIMEAFEEIGITEANQILDASISLYAESVENDAPQQIIIRRVLLPWKEGEQKSQPAAANELTYNSALHRNFPWNKPPAQAMLEGINGDQASDYNGSEDVAYRIDGMTPIHGAGVRYVWKGALITDAFRLWLANPDHNYGYLFALRDGTGSVRFTSQEHPDETRRPVLTIRYTTNVNRDE